VSCCDSSATSPANQQSFRSGLFAYIVINGAIYIVVRLSGHTIVPENYELKEYWSWRPPGEKPWFARAVLRGIYWVRYRRDREASFSINSRDETFSAEHYRSSDTASKAEDVPRITTPEPLRQIF
jgi:AGZA family xanthine/uracil permease-like MFS transporter